MAAAEGGCSVRLRVRWMCGRGPKWGGGAAGEKCRGGGCQLRCSTVGANENRGEGPFLMAL